MTPLLPQLPKGFGRRKLIEMLPILFVSNPFFTSLVPFFFFFDNWNPKKIRLSRLIMGFPFYYTCSNDSMSAVYQGRSKKFQSFLWISCMSLYMTCGWTRGGRSYYPKSFSHFNQMEKKLIWGKKKIFKKNFSWPFYLPPPIFVQIFFLHIWTF